MGPDSSSRGPPRCAVRHPRALLKQPGSYPCRCESVEGRPAAVGAPLRERTCCDERPAAARRGRRVFRARGCRNARPEPPHTNTPRRPDGVFLSAERGRSSRRSAPLGVLHLRRVLECGRGFGRSRPLLGSGALLRPCATRNVVLRRLVLALVVMQGSMSTPVSAAQTGDAAPKEGASASKMVHGHGDSELTWRPSGVSPSASGWTRASDVPWDASQRVPLSQVRTHEPHLACGEANLYKEIAVALKDAEWRQPGLVAFATKLATSASRRWHHPTLACCQPPFP
jgi:hypothetical protein